MAKDTSSPSKPVVLSMIMFYWTFGESWAGTLLIPPAVTTLV
ncbi:10462_t:CDS:2, partial [Rhizophagus irregularis]